jgi:hypothetical protein
MTRELVLGLSLFALSGLAPFARAGTISLYNWAFNVDGTIFPKPGPLPTVPPVIFNTGSFDFSGGLGALTFAVAGPPGAHTVDIYLDHDLLAGTPASDLSAAVGTPASGEAWEIGVGKGASLYAHFTTNSYTDVNNMAGPGDVATGLSFAFTTTAANPWGVITLSVSTTAPASGFYLHQWNTSGSTPTDIYISASEVNSPTPEPSGILLFATGLCGIAVWRQRAAVKHL